MPVFATPARWRDAIFSPMAPIGLRKRTFATVLLAFCFFTPSLTFVRTHTQSGQVGSFTGIDLAKTALGNSGQNSLEWQKGTAGKTWETGFLVSLAITYGALTLYAVGIAFPPLRKLVVLGGVLAPLGSLSGIDFGTFRFATHVLRVSAGPGLYALVVLTIGLGLLPFIKSIDE